MIDKTPVPDRRIFYCLGHETTVAPATLYIHNEMCDIREMWLIEVNGYDANGDAHSQEVKLGGTD